MAKGSYIPPAQCSNFIHSHRIVYVTLGLIILLSVSDVCSSINSSFSYIGVRYMVEKFGHEVETQGWPDGLKKKPLPRGVYTATSLGYYYSTFYTMYYKYGSSEHYTNRITNNKEACSNLELVSDNTTMGKFSCPLPFEPITHTFCCGVPSRQYCCSKHIPTGETEGALLCASIAFGLALAFVIVSYIITDHARKSGWGDQYNVDFWQPRRLKGSTFPAAASGVSSISQTLPVQTTTTVQPFATAPSSTTSPTGSTLPASSHTEYTNWEAQGIGSVPPVAAQPPLYATLDNALPSEPPPTYASLCSERNAMS